MAAQAKKTAYILHARRDGDFADLLRRHVELRFDLLPHGERRAIEKADFVIALVSADLLGMLYAQDGAWTKLDQLIVRAKAERLITVLVRHVMLDGVPWIPVAGGRPICRYPLPRAQEGAGLFPRATTDCTDHDALCTEIVTNMVAGLHDRTT